MFPLKGGANFRDLPPEGENKGHSLSRTEAMPHVEVVFLRKVLGQRSCAVI